MRSLLASLNDHPVALLRGIAELRGMTLATNNRGDAAAQLAAALNDPAATAAALAVCSPAAQAAWRALFAAGGRMKAGVFARTSGGEIRAIGPGRLEREVIWREPENPAEELWYRGLIYRAFADFGDGPLEYFYIPEDLAAPAEMAQSPAQPTAPTIASVPAPEAARKTQNALAVDVCAILSAARELPAQIDKTGRLRDDDTQRFTAGLLPPEREAARLELALTLARVRGWLKPDRSRLVLDAGSATAWLRLTHWEQMTALFKAWRDGGDAWNDLRHVPALVTEGDWRNDPGLARRTVTQALRVLEPAAWYPISGLIAQIKAATPDFQRPDGDYTRWYVRDAASGGYLAGFESWGDVEGRLLRFLLTGPLFWLGAVALDGAAAPSVFRLTSFGAAWLNGRTPETFPRPARAAVGEDFTVTAPLTLPLIDRFRLLRFTEPQFDGYEFGQPTRHRITRGSLARARAGGVKPDAIVDFLRHATGGKLSPRVASALARWGQQCGTVRISKGAVLRVEDASILATLRADPVIAPLLGELISAQAVLVREANLPRLLAIIQDTGYTVKSD
jgi:hypothetical protein